MTKFSLSQKQVVAEKEGMFSQPIASTLNQTSKIPISKPNPEPLKHVMAEREGLFSPKRGIAGATYGGYARLVNLVYSYFPTRTLFNIRNF